MNWLYEKWGISADMVNNKDFKFGSVTELRGSAFTSNGYSNWQYEALETLMRKIC